MHELHKQRLGVGHCVMSSLNSWLLEVSKFSTHECIETKDGGSQLLKEKKKHTSDLLSCGMWKDKSLYLALFLLEFIFSTLVSFTRNAIERLSENRQRNQLLKEDVLDLLTALLKFNCVLSTTVATQCTYQRFIDWLPQTPHHLINKHFVMAPSVVAVVKSPMT